MALPSSTVYDCIVIGAGIQGSFTAYHLAKNKKRTLLLEQFPLPHSRGSSHGQTRIIRRAYAEDFYTNMMEESYQLWADLERESGIKLYRQTGLLVIAPPGNEEFESICRNMERNKTSWERFTKEQLMAKHPEFILNPGEVACCDNNAGVLYADKALRAVQEQFKRMGGVIQDAQKVKHIQPGQVVTVTTTSDIYEAKNIVITAGPWAQKVLSPLGLELPLKTLRINVCYWKEKTPGRSGLLQNLPAFLGVNLNGEEHEVYGLPCQEYPGLIKICFHGGNEADPEERELQVKTPQIPDIQILCNFISKYLPDLHPKPAVMEQCMYTNTPDNNFILDYHPLYKNIVIGSGFSGHGFKLSPLVGKILSELSMGKEPSYDLTPFRIARFNTPSASL
ncbi:PREDICTED: peroxisomal sarcosine oxidase [Nanorana parkeri]|uniref:peroxisomal sarcosine oxidase n=1 Tax=Nanorana parkeri TaxID=125878 RepID=UPI000854103D|nr:PREDICTED: peroxisomal sarcosine oxidase [Nanorana parkeri]